MYKLLHRIDLTRLYERYNYLVTNEDRKKFVRTVYTLSLCAVAAIFIWYCGFINLSLQKQNELSINDESQSNKPQALGDIKNTDDILYTDINKNI